MTPPLYLKKRRLGWYVQLPVPRAKQAALGCKVLTRSLQTRDEAEALKRRHRVIAELQEMLGDDAATPTASSSDALLASARIARAQVEAGRLSMDDAEPALDAAVDDFIAEKATRLKLDEHGEPDLPAADRRNITRAYRTLSGSGALTLGYQAERYLAQLEGSELTRQTVADKKRHLGIFLDWIDTETEARRVSKARAAQFLDEVLLPRRAAVQTKRVVLNTIRQFFDWMETRDVVKFNPFEKTGKLLKSTTRGTEQKRRPWSPEELLRMLQELQPSDPLWSLTALGAFTGARREDLCALRTDAVDGHFLSIREGKTAAAVRRVPIHPTIQPLVRHLSQTSPDGFLIPGLLTGGIDEKRGHYIGKRFSYALRKAGIEDPKVVFHAFRNAVLTQLSEANVPIAIRQQIVGHKRKGTTEAVYTDRAPDRVLAEAMRHVSYGAEVDALICATGLPKVTLKAKRRSKRVAATA